MNIGDVIESAIWLTGTETPEIRKHYETDVRESMDNACRREGFLHGPVTFIEKSPGLDRVPSVPEHVTGPRVKLLVAETTVTARTSQGSFIAQLEKSDLDRLRAITKRACIKSENRILSDLECDKIIDEIGPDAALDVLRRNSLH